MFPTGKRVRVRFRIPICVDIETLDESTSLITTTQISSPGAGCGRGLNGLGTNRGYRRGTGRVSGPNYGRGNASWGRGGRGASQSN